jgi:hypothetical protein
MCVELFRFVRDLCAQFPAVRAHLGGAKSLNAADGMMRICENVDLLLLMMMMMMIDDDVVVGERLTMLLAAQNGVKLEAVINERYGGAVNCLRPGTRARDVRSF